MAACGLYGKIPSEGDFVTRRLPWEFTSVWDDWLQQGMQASREALGLQWLPLYLSAPIWRFQVAPGVCGPAGWRGVFMASVDRVGRHFPLTLAFPEPGVPALSALTGDTEAWLAIEDAALAGLSPTRAIADFDVLVRALSMPGGVPTEAGDVPRPHVCLHTGGSEDVPAWGEAFSALPPAGSFARLIAPAFALASSMSQIDLS